MINKETMKIVTVHAGINLGNRYTKISTDTLKEAYATSITPVAEKDILDKDDESLIKVNGEYYYVGEGNSTADKFEHRNYKILRIVSLFGIAKELKRNKRNFTRTSKKFKYETCIAKIGLGLSIEEFKEESNINTLREEFDNKEFEIEYQDVKVKIVFNVIDIQAECYAHYQMSGDTYDKLVDQGYRRIFFIDFGSKTWDMFALIDGKIRKPIGLPNAGTIYMMTKIAKEMSNEAEIDDVERMLRNGQVMIGTTLFKAEDYKDKVKQFISDNMLRVDDAYDKELEKYNMIVAFGGGVEFAEDVLVEKFGKDVIKVLPDAIYANSDAYYDASFSDDEE